jgi:hypothetical protein
MVVDRQLIKDKIRRLTARPSDNQITDTQLNEYIQNYILYDMPVHLKLESFRNLYQFITQPNVDTYNFPTDYYIETMPPVYVGGYQVIMSQSRDSFFKFNPRLTFMEKNVSTGTGATGPYSGTLTNIPAMRGHYPNFGGSLTIPMNYMIYGILISGDNGMGGMTNLVDDGFGFLYSPDSTVGDVFDPSGAGALNRGTINYLTGAFTVNAGLLGFTSPVSAGGAINAQYIPYVASRPQSALFYQDQITLSPIPDQAYTVSFEAFKKMNDLISDADMPELKDVWQVIAFGVAGKIFEDNGDLENVVKFRPLLDEQIRLSTRRTISQYSTERVATIFTEQTGLLQNFNNLFGGI